MLPQNCGISEITVVRHFNQNVRAAPDEFAGKRREMRFVANHNSRLRVADRKKIVTFSGLKTADQRRNQRLDRRRHGREFAERNEMDFIILPDFRALRIDHYRRIEVIVAVRICFSGVK